MVFYNQRGAAYPRCVVQLDRAKIDSKEEMGREGEPESRREGGKCQASIDDRRGSERGEEQRGKALPAKKRKKTSTVAAVTAPKREKNI